MEDTVVPNDEDISNEIIMDYGSLTLAIEPLQNEILAIEGLDT